MSTGISRGMAAVINENLCIGCGACAKVCPQGAIIIQQREVDQISAQRVWALKNKIAMLEEKLEWVKSIIHDVDRR